MTNTTSLYLSLILLSILTQGTFTQCVDGCLKCTETQNEASALCLVCDVFSFYVPFGNGLCIKVEVENCDVPSPDRSQSKCLKCKDGFIYDTSTRKCKEVVHPIEHCQQYGSSAECVKCAKDYIIKDDLCVIVDPLVPNCEVYVGDPPVCASCSSGHYLNLADKTCSALPTDDADCLIYSRSQCLACDSGYLLNNNYTLNQSLEGDFLQNMVVANYSSSEGLTGVHNVPISNCQKTIVADCAVYESFDKCSECLPMYFLAEEGKACVKFPEDPIPLCQTYSDNVTCLTCVSAAYKDANQDCVESTYVESCTIYSQTADECLECEYGFYLNGSVCTARENSLKSEQCDVLNKTADECSSCNPGFVLRTQRDYCIATLPFCSDSSVSSSNVVTCNECMSGYGLNPSGNCEYRDVDYCQGYDGFTVFCQACHSGYYLKNGGTANNSCEELTVKNCGTPSTTSDTCVTCNSYYFLNDSTNLCELQNKPNCLSFDNNTNDCTNCMFGYWLDDSTKSCVKRLIENCQSPTAGADECDTCDEGYYPVAAAGDTPASCTAQQVDNCTAYTTNTNDCTACEDGHWLESTSACTAHAKPNCTTHSSTSADCTKCDSGYYLVTAATAGVSASCPDPPVPTNPACANLIAGECAAQDDIASPGCIEFTEDVKDCTKCANLKKLDGVVCADITASNCVKSEENNDVCLQCETGYILASPTSCTARATVTTSIDTLCAANGNSVDDGTCTVCTDSNQLAFRVKSFTLNPVPVANCSEFNSATGVCNVCAKDKITSLASPTLCDGTYDAATMNCRLKTDDQTTLSDGSSDANCELCVDGYYVDTATSDTCTKRTNTGFNCDEDGIALKADSCGYCKENSFYGAVKNIATCTKGTFYSDTAPDNCDITQALDRTACAVCTHDAVAATCATATAGNGYMNNILSSTLTITDYTENTSLTSANCDAEEYSLGNDGTVVCTNCTALKKFISKYDSADVFFGMTFKPSGMTSPHLDIPALNDGCTLTSATVNIIQNKTVGPAPDLTETFTPLFDFASDTANMSYFYSSQNLVVALGCSGDFYPLVDVGNADGADNDYTGEYTVTVTSCTESTVGNDKEAYKNINKHFSGLDYGYQATDVLPLSTLIYKDSCILDSELFVVLFDTTASSSLKLQETTAGNAFCVSKQLEDFSGEHTYVANCQVHLDTTNTDTTGYTSAQTLTCISCKPGFYGARASATDPTITACNPIENCDTSYENLNTWMNSCQKCKPGFAWVYDDDNASKLYVQYHQCVATTATNCEVVVDGSNNQCALCAKGYTLTTAKLCVKMEIDGCDDYTMGKIVDAGTVTAITDNDLLLQLNAAAHYLYDLDTKTIGFGCKTCEAGYTLVVGEAASSDSTCLGTTSFDHDEIVPNCKHHATTASQCAICNEDFVVDASSTPTANQCVAVGAHGANCKIITSGVCTTCFRGDAIAGTGCPLYANCQTIGEDTSTNPVCEVCEENYKPNPSDNKECIPIVEDTPCIQFGLDNICVKCSVSTKSPITYLNSSGTGIRSECVDKYSIGDTADNIIVNGRLADAYYVIDPSKTTFDEKFYVGGHTSAEHLVMTDFALTVASTLSVVTHSVCIPIPVTNFCKPNSLDDFGRCEECIAGYVLDADTKLCNEGPVLNCIKYNSAGTVCEECSSDFYYNSSSTSCEVRLVRNCLEYSLVADECTDCEENKFYLKNAQCFVYTVEFCKTYNANENECTACETGQRYLNASNNTCIPYTVKFCSGSTDQGYNTSADACLECASNRYLSASTNDCELYSVMNCENYNSALDQCVDCKAGFFLDTANNCLLPQAEHCQVRNSTSDKCDSCVNNYYLVSAVSGVCAENTAENCAQKKVDANECDTCLPAHYQDSADANKCKPHTVDFCNGYETSTDECTECISGYFKDTDNFCKLNTSAFCSSKSTTENKCDICKSSYYLDSNTECVPVTNFTCLNLTSNTNDCADCKVKYYLDSTTKTCMSVTEVDHCSEYESNADECRVCNTGYYLGTSKKACYPNPNGIAKCVLYQDASTCTQCNSTTFLENNKCMPLVATAVDGCAAYSADGICSVCDSGKFLNSTDNACESPTASGCLTWEDKENCATCAANELLDGTPKLCVTTTISNCAVVSGTVASEVCDSCDAGYFLAENACTVSATLVTDCIKYSADGVCEICDSGKVTNSDGTSCGALDTSMFGLNCAVATSTASPVCSVCKNGKMLGEDGKCSVSCEMENCLICDPLDTAKCSVCLPGYHMDTELKCILNGTTTDDDDSPISVNILRSSMILFLLITLLFKRE